MKKKHSLICRFSTVCFVVILVYATQATAQKTVKDTVHTDIVQVVSSYAPEIPVFIKKMPAPKFLKKKRGKKTWQQKSAPFLFFPKPIFDTLKPPAWQPKKKEKPDANFLSVGYGMYNTAHLNGFYKKQFGRHKISFYTKNSISNGRVVTSQLPTDYLQNNLGLAYVFKGENQYFGGANYQNRKYYWYGIPKKLQQPSSISKVGKTPQILSDLYLYAGVHFSSGNLQRLTVDTRFFGGNFDLINEQKGVATAKFTLGKSKDIFLKAQLDFLNGNQRLENIHYGYVGSEVTGYHVVNEGDFYLFLGIKIRYNRNIGKQINKKNQTFLYPKIKVNYQWVEDFLNLYANISGGFQANTFRDLSLQNPYLTPTLNVFLPTNESLNIQTGIKGKLTDALAYNTNVSYIIRKQQSFFVKNTGTIDIKTPYGFDNTFTVVYDDAKQLQWSGELSGRIFKGFDVKLVAQTNLYYTDKLKSAWNIPNATLDFACTYRLKKWHIALDGNLVGLRKERSIFNGKTTAEKLPIFANVNLHSGYQISKTLALSLRFTNLLMNQQPLFVGYLPQSFTGVFGVDYRF